jgi:hypothetical protein
MIKISNNLSLNGIITQGNKKIFFFCALNFRPVSGVIWGADSGKCIG